MVHGPDIYPEYMQDLETFVCPSDQDGQDRFTSGRWNVDGNPSLPFNACRLDDLSYLYSPWPFSPIDYMLDPSDDNKEYLPGVTGSLNFLLAYAAKTDAIEDLNAGGYTPEKEVEAREIAEEAFEFTHEVRGEVTLQRLREGIERFFITDINNPGASSKAQSELAILYDEVHGDAKHFSHVPGGGNVLYMDGHVEWLIYPSEYPASTSWATLINFG